MNEYVLLTDSTSDLPKEIVDEFDIRVLPMKFTLDGELHVDDGSVSVDNFYEKVKNKSIVSTSQINPGEFEEYFEKYLKLGKDIVYVCFSSGLSGTYNSACIAAEELKKRYPENQVKIIRGSILNLGF